METKKKIEEVGKGTNLVLAEEQLTPKGVVSSPYYGEQPKRLWKIVDRPAFEAWVRKMGLCLCLFVACMAAGAQTKVRVNAQGDYVSVSTRTASAATQTGKYYVTSDGQRLPVWKTSNGKLFVNRISKKTGKTYRSYITVDAK